MIFLHCYRCKRSRDQYFLLAIRFLFAYHRTHGYEGVKNHVAGSALVAALGKPSVSRRIALQRLAKT
jgi:hypothetical protein